MPLSPGSLGAAEHLKSGQVGILHSLRYHLFIWSESHSNTGCKRHLKRSSHGAPSSVISEPTHTGRLGLACLSFAFEVSLPKQSTPLRHTH